MITLPDFLFDPRFWIAFWGVVIAIFLYCVVIACITGAEMEEKWAEIEDWMTADQQEER